MQSDLHTIAATVRRKGYRFTPQRQLILDAIREGGGHSTPEEICRRVQAKSPAVNRATVYRNVDFLCEVRLVVAARIGRQMYYEIADATPHHHLVCRRCNGIKRIEHRTVKGLFDKLEREHSFVVDMDHLTLLGLCRACARAAANTRHNAGHARPD